MQPFVGAYGTREVCGGRRGVQPRVQQPVRACIQQLLSGMITGFVLCFGVVSNIRSHRDILTVSTNTNTLSLLLLSTRNS